MMKLVKGRKCKERREIETHYNKHIIIGKWLTYEITIHFCTPEIYENVKLGDRLNRNTYKHIFGSKTEVLNTFKKSNHVQDKQCNILAV